MDVRRHVLAALLLIISYESKGETTQEHDVDTDVELKLMFITSKNLLFNSSGSRAAVDMALDRINRDATLLSGYRLTRTEALDSNCSRITSLKQFFGKLSDSKARYIAVIGAGCSPATQPIAEVINYYNMPMVSYASSAEVLSNRNSFPSFFRTTPSEIVLTPGIANLVLYFNWRQITFITEKETIFLDTQAEVRRMLSDRGVKVDKREFRSDRGPSSVDDLFVKDRDMRVFVLNMYSLFASQVLCQAYREGMYYPHYVWITYGWYNMDWWRGSNGTHNCTDEEMLRVLNHSLSVIQYPVTNGSKETQTGLTLDEFFREYDSRIQKENLEHTVTAPLAYDATWTLALALNKSVDTVNNVDSIPYVCMNRNITYANSKLVPFENFTYSNDLLGCILKENLKATNFTGISGEVYFDRDGTRMDDSVRIEQYRINATASSVQRVVVGYLVDNITQLSYIEGESNSTLWPEGVPHDGIPSNVTTTIGLPLMVIIDIFAFAGVGFAIFCLAFNIVFRARKVVRLTSPNLNYLIIVGAVFIYLSVVFLAMPFLELQLSTVYCNLHQWLFSVGNTLCFAVVLAKMWRVYYIFSDPSPNRKSPKDWQLLVFIALLVGVDVIILLVPTALPSSRITATLAENKEKGSSYNGEGILEQHYFFHCQNTPHLAWLGVSYGYKLLLQFVAVYLAFQTRKVKIRALNDSKEIAIIIYITSLILIALVGISFAVASSYPNTYVALAGSGRITYPTVILAFIFIPKMIYLYQDPSGEKIFSPSHGSLPGRVNRGSDGDSKTKEKVTFLEKRVQELELELKDYQNRANLSEFLTEPNKGPHEPVSDELQSPSKSTLDSKDSSQCCGITDKTLVNGTE